MRSRLLAGALSAVVLTSGLAATTSRAAEVSPVGPAAHLSSKAVRASAPTDAKAPSPRAGLGAADGTGRRADAPSASLTEIFGFCPAGQKPSRTLSVAGFEDLQLPLPDYSKGWSLTTGDAGAGQVNAISTIGTGVAVKTYVNTNYIPQKAPTANVYLSFLLRGSWDGDAPLLNGALFVNESAVGLYPAEDWTRVFVDVSAESRAEGGTLDVFFGLATDGTEGQDVSMEVDDARLYTCAAAPNAKVRGDWTGEGLVDVLGVTASGDLYLYPGRGDGRISSGQQIGNGWGRSTWLGSPGDVTGDGRTDLVARDADGTMRLYPGLGFGGLGSPRVIGTGWNGFTAFATPGDVNLDGRPDLVARTGEGALALYSFSATGRLSGGERVGTGWNGMRTIIGIGDLSGDRRGDLVGVLAQDQCFYGYLAKAPTGFRGVGRVGCGWSTMNALTSPGDLTRDGLGDVVSRRTDGTLWVYPGRSGGGVRSGMQIGSGWNGISLFL